VKQIDALSVSRATAEQVSRGDPTAMTRLLDAAAVLRDPRPGAQVFGLQLPPGGLEGMPALSELCLARARDWAPVLADSARPEMAKLLRRLGLPPLVQEAAPPVVAHQLQVFIRAEAEDLDTEEPVTDLAVLASLAGVPPQNDVSLIDLSCIADAVSGREGPWARDGRALLVFERGALFCRLTFDLVRPPTPDEQNELIAVITDELFFTGWGMNLDWALDEEHPEVAIRTSTRVISSEICPA
jgi:hypothetical protein